MVGGGGDVIPCPLALIPLRIVALRPLRGLPSSPSSPSRVVQADEADEHAGAMWSLGCIIQIRIQHENANAVCDRNCCCGIESYVAE